MNIHQAGKNDIYWFDMRNLLPIRLTFQGFNYNPNWARDGATVYFSGFRDSSDDSSGDDLYRRANKLWDAGQKAEAATLYKLIREKHKLSLVYTLNRSRIKK